MPSASSQSSMQITAQMENNDLTKTVLSLLEKKVRNLEKRKGKLDGYKKLVDAGQSLNDDQKLAVGQLNQVEQNLEFARDLQKNITQICNEHQKLQKKLAKRDQAAQAAAQRDGDISKVCQVLELQSLMDNLSEDVRVDFLNGTNGAVVVSEESFVQIDDFYKLITPNADADEPIKEQQMAASRHIVKFLEGSPDSVVDTTYKALNELVTSIKKCDYFEQSQGNGDNNEDEEEEEAAAEGDNDEDQEGSGDDNTTETQNQTVESTNGPSDTQVNGGNSATTKVKEGGNVAMFVSNEHGLNFLSESEVESKPPASAGEIPPALEKQSEQAPPESNTGRDEGWGDQGGEGTPGDQGDDTGFDTVHHSNGYSRGGRGGRGGYRRGDGYNRRGGPPGERGNRRGRGGFGGPPRGGRGGYGQQDQRHGGPSGRGSRGGPRGGPRGDRGGRRGGGPPQ